MKVNLIIGLMLFSVIAFSESDICKSYNVKEFVLEKTTDKRGKGIIEKIKIDNLKIYFFKDRSKDNPITLEYSVNQHKKYYRYIYCMKDGNKFNQKKSKEALIRCQISLPNTNHRFTK